MAQLKSDKLNQLQITQAEPGVLDVVSETGDKLKNVVTNVASNVVTGSINAFFYWPKSVTESASVSVDELDEVVVVELEVSVYNSKVVEVGFFTIKDCVDVTATESIEKVVVTKSTDIPSLKLCAADVVTTPLQPILDLLNLPHEKFGASKFFMHIGITFLTQ